MPTADLLTSVSTLPIIVAIYWPVVGIRFIRDKLSTIVVYSRSFIALFSYITLKTERQTNISSNTDLY